MILGASANMNLFTTAVRTGYDLAYGTTPIWHSRLAQVIPITNESVLNGWVGMLDKAREWIGPRQVRTPAPQTYLVTPKPFELTWGVDRFRLDDDKLNYGLYMPYARMHGEQDAKVPDYQLRDLIFNLGTSWTGAPQLGTDGLSHWNVAHLVDPFDAAKGTFCNDYRGGVSVDSVTVGGALSPNAFKSVFADASIRKVESGEAGLFTPDMLEASTHLRGEVEVILKSAMISPASFGGLGTGAVGTANAPFVGVMNNPLQGYVDYELIEDFGITAATRLQWLLTRSKGVVKPFTCFIRSGAVRAERVAETDPSVFDSHTYQFGSWQRMAPAWGLPMLSSISGPTAV
jgi:hypothetical protein